MPTPADQSVGSVEEHLSVFDDAEKHGLIDVKDKETARALDAVGALDTADAQTRLNACLASGPAAQRALDLIAPLFEPGDVIELTALDPAGGSAGSYCGRLDAPNERAALVAFINDHNGRNNLYLGANPRKADMAGKAKRASAPDVTTRRTVMLDLDAKDADVDVDADWTRTRVALADVGAILEVHSGNGHQVWLLVETVDGAELAASCAPLAEAMARLGADDMSDPPRLARLPFTVNLPTASKRKRGAVPRLAVASAPTKPNGAPQPVAALCTALTSVADRLGLPGRGNAATAPRNGSGGGEKIGWAAPSADLLRMALEHLPNKPGGAFDNRDDWQCIGHAVKGASVEGGIEAEGHAVWLGWSAKWGSDPDAATAFWDTCKTPHTGWGTLMRTLERVNPTGHEQVKAAAAKAAFADAAATNVARIKGAGLKPVALFRAKNLPPRKFLYGRSVIAENISMLVAPGGAGKSALTMVDAVAMASGRALLPGDKPVRPLRVLYHNGEDGMDEQLRRLAAVLEHHRLKHSDLNGNLYLTSGRDLPLKLARQAKNGAEEVPGAVDGLVDLMLAKNIDVLILDPLGAMHDLSENSNEAANYLMGMLRQIMDRTSAAIGLVHHSNKAAAMDMAAAGVGASRGASAFTDAARVVRQLARMTASEAAQMGIAECNRRDYLRIDNGKANLSRAEDAHWVKIIGVRLDNGADLWPDGDTVQTVECWSPPTQAPGTPQELHMVQQAMMAATDKPKAAPQSPDWIGYLVANVLRLNIGAYGTKAQDRTPEQAANRVRIQSMVAGWIRDAALEEKTEHDPKTRKDVKIVAMGTPAILSNAASDLDAERNNEAKN
jgi:AAA domain/Primase C terminal 2 (PriCT-2)